MDRLKAQILRFLPEENKFLHKIYEKFIDDHAYLWSEAENLDLARLRYILFVIIKLFYEEHKHLQDINQIDQQEFNKAVRELISNRDALLQKAQKAQLKEIEHLGVEGWFNAFRKDIENINKIIQKYETERNIIITLHDILDANKSPSTEYQRLIEGRETDYNARFSQEKNYQIWLDFGPDVEHPILKSDKEECERGCQFFIQKLSGGVLVDLGGAEGNLRESALVWGVKTYINVDRGEYSWQKDGKRLPPNPLKAAVEFDESKLHIIGVNSDMLDFVSRMRDNSANFTINGIDFNIIEDDAYHAALAKEVIRATKPGGIIFGANSEIVHPLYALKNRGAKIRGIDIQKEYNFRAWEMCFFYEKLM